ncbi:MAG TPA: dihydropteroate synthase [Spirochaetota bacterium]|nr:dihydropteroate synthase [Spirochaetota bacterium]
MRADLGTRTLIMGIVNVTPDSFYDGGKYRDHAAAVSHAVDMVDAGADIIDIGGESSRPGARPVSSHEECDRVCPVIEALRNRVTVPISVDTYKAEVARAAISAGASMINDISGLRSDPSIASIAADAGAYLVLMHMRGTPATMQHNTHYDDLIAEIAESLAESARIAQEHGVAREKIIVDPGIGFGKTLDDNYKLINNIAYFRRLGYPVLIGLSRKSLIGGLLKDGEDRLPGTIALNSMAAYFRADIVRVHDVREHRLALRMIDHARSLAASDDAAR